MTRRETKTWDNALSLSINVKKHRSSSIFSKKDEGGGERKVKETEGVEVEGRWSGGDGAEEMEWRRWREGDGGKEMEGRRWSGGDERSK